MVRFPQTFYYIVLVILLVFTHNRPIVYKLPLYRTLMSTTHLTVMKHFYNLRLWCKSHTHTRLNRFRKSLGADTGTPWLFLLVMYQIKWWHHMYLCVSGGRQTAVELKMTWECHLTIYCHPSSLYKYQKDTVFTKMIKITFIREIREN